MGFFSFLNPVNVFDALAGLPGTPEAALTGLYRGIEGDASWNPYDPDEASVWDIGAGGTELSQDQGNRDLGRTIGTLVGGYFAYPALAGAGTASEAGIGALTAEELAAASAADYAGGLIPAYGTEAGYAAGLTGASEAGLGSYVSPEIGGMAEQTAPYANAAEGQVVDVVGSRVPAETMPTGTTPGFVPPLETGTIPPLDAGTLPPISEVPNIPTGPGASNAFLDFIAKNPRLAVQAGTLIAGGLFGGGDSGGGSPSSPGGIGSIGAQNSLTSTPAEKFQRQYVAPQAGYRPGFDPEHRYFTGIGAVGTGG